MTRYDERGERLGNFGVYGFGKAGRRKLVAGPYPTARAAWEAADRFDNANPEMALDNTLHRSKEPGTVGKRFVVFDGLRGGPAEDPRARERVA